MPQFWNGLNLTWFVIARADGHAYSLFGVADPIDGMSQGILQSAEYTSTHTTFVVIAGSASFTLDFLSPVSPQHYVRQRLPFSYLTVSASGLDGATPKVQVYSDIDNSWIGQFGENVATAWTWDTSEANTHIFTLAPLEPAPYHEVDDMAQWGTAVYCTQQKSSILSATVGDVTGVRTEFAASGSLSDDWNWKLGSVVAYNQDLDTVGSAKNVTFVVGYVREAAVNYMGQPRANYYRSSAADINQACVHAVLDFPNAEAEARKLDTEIANKATSIAGSNYSDILALSVRQAFGALEITITADTLDTNDVMVFVKEISSSGNVNTIDVLMPMSPIFYVLAPEYIRLTLEPVMRYLDTGAWPRNWTIHDIGSHYPNATGHGNGTAEQMPVEECGNILLLAYMYQVASGNNDWCNQYQSLFQKYADYLILNGLYPTPQLSSDDGAGPEANQTGLAIKSAIALNAYGAMTSQPNYSDVGRQFADTLYNQSAGTDPDHTHFTLNQQDDETWGMRYNLYLDVLLNLNTFSTEAYAMQTNYYPSVRQAKGVALDSRVDWGKTDWMHFAAAVAMSPGVENLEVRDMLVGDVHAFITNGQNSVPFSDSFFVETNGSDTAGTYNLYRARPVVSGHFALMALDVED